MGFRQQEAQHVFTGYCRRRGVYDRVAAKVYHAVSFGISRRGDVQQRGGRAALTKGTDSFYIGRRNIASEYDPTGPYNFPAWQSHFDASIRSTYETLHQTLLYTDEKQDFDVALATFRKISELLSAIDE